MFPPLVSIETPRSADEIKKDLEFSRRHVTVSFETAADLLEDEGSLTDEDWITLGRFVAECAREARRRKSLSVDR